MGRLLIVAVLLLPIAEIAMFIIVGQAIGLWWTLGLVVAAGIFGALLLRQQGSAVLSRLRSSYTERRMPARTVADAMLIGLAALFLILPGFLSDIVGIALLLPPVRSLIYAAFATRVVVVRPAPGPPDPQLGTIDLGEDDYRPR